MKKITMQDDGGREAPGIGEPPKRTWSDAGMTITISLVAAIVAPLVLSVATAYMAREDKALDWARQDAVAARVAQVAIAVKTTDNKLDQIHTLVNSAFTASMQSELDANSALLVQLLKNRGDAGVIAALEAKIIVLGAALEERKKQSKILEAQALAKGK